MFSEDPILLPEIVDQIVLVTVHPASEREDEELQRRRHSLRLLGRLDQHRPSRGRFFAPYVIRANVPERVAMLLTGHKSRAIFDRYNIIHEQELLDAGDQLVEYLAQQAQAVPARRRPHPAGPAAPRTASPLRLVRRTTA